MVNDAISNKITIPKVLLSILIRAPEVDAKTLTAYALKFGGKFDLTVMVSLLIRAMEEKNLQDLDLCLKRTSSEKLVFAYDFELRLLMYYLNLEMMDNNSPPLEGVLDFILQNLTGWVQLKRVQHMVLSLRLLINLGKFDLVDRYFEISLKISTTPPSSSEAQIGKPTQVGKGTKVGTPFKWESEAVKVLTRVMSNSENLSYAPESLQFNVKSKFHILIYTS